MGMEKQVEDFFRSMKEKGYDTKELTESLFNEKSDESFLNIKKAPISTW